MSRYRPLNERIKDYLPVELRLTSEELQKELKRCQDCGIPFCHAAGCPLANLIPEIHADALSGRWESALARLLATSPFPEFTARVCPALCEGSCVQALNEEPVPARLTELEVIERGFAQGLLKPRKPLEALPLSVGVVGSGPSGLAAAYYLSRAGASVTVYEKDKSPGGFLRYGIPDFKLEKSVIDRRISLMRREGVVFQTEVEAGLDISPRLLFKRHQAVILALGARRKRDLPIPGRELIGVHFATDYLSAQNRLVAGEISEIAPDLLAAGKSVVVVGGGDTGSDCVGTALRQGAASVVQIEILPKPPAERAPDNPWPQWPRILRTTSSHLEGGERKWAVGTAEFLPNIEKSGFLGALSCHEVEWEEENGRLIKPVPVKGTDFVIKADLALLAMGFTGVESGPLCPDGSAKPDARGRLSKGRYVCGDAASGPSLVVRAMADGLKVAESILEDFLKGELSAGAGQNAHLAEAALSQGAARGAPANPA
ncbi:MAG: glutamate synthase subunit beta [Deltaproteobacteria bacterium]|jgi:glutamate synthase (NADPH/NADH) small chain|nr:glutamate synthase subunit beta [Deltaproteobacteria bacterium]